MVQNVISCNINDIIMSSNRISNYLSTCYNLFIRASDFSKTLLFLVHIYFVNGHSVCGKMNWAVRVRVICTGLWLQFANANITCILENDSMEDPKVGMLVSIPDCILYSMGIYRIST